MTPPSGSDPSNSVPSGSAGDCDELAPLLGVYALDAVDPDEAAVVDAHLETCDACRRQVEDHRDALAALPGGEGSGPDRVWERIAAGIAAPAVRDGAPATRDRPGHPAYPGGRTSGRSRRRRVTVAAAVTAVAAAAAVAIGIQSARVSHLQSRVDALGGTSGAGRGIESVAAAVSDPHASHLELMSTENPAQALGRLIVLRSGAAYLVDAHLPGLPAARTYQLWAITAGRAISVGLLGAQPATVAFTVDPAAVASEYLVTVEPAGGVVAPTANPVARAAG